MGASRFFLVEYLVVHGLLPTSVLFVSPAFSLCRVGRMHRYQVGSTWTQTSWCQPRAWCWHRVGAGTEVGAGTGVGG